MAAQATTSELTAARRAMACEFSITIPAAAGSHVDAACAALDEIERLEASLSVYIDDSELARINGSAAGSPARCTAETFRLLRFASKLAEATGGAFDPAAGALVKAWGFYRPPRRVPEESVLAAALESSGYRQVGLDDRTRRVSFLRPGLELNLGAIGKGFALDTAAALLRHRHGVSRALLQGGQSSFFAIGAPPDQPEGWRIALGHPCRPESSICEIVLRDCALGTSGAANQYFVQNGRRYGHILDPRSGRPAHRLLSATAVAPTAAEADALSTAFFVLGIEGTRDFLSRRPRLGAVLIRPKPDKPAALEITQLGAVRMERIT